LAITVYPYGPGSYNVSQLQTEIVNAGLPTPAYINGSGNTDTNSFATNINIAYDPALTAPQKTTLDSTVAAHVAVATGPRILAPSGGGTGTGTVPAYLQMLLADNVGIYHPLTLTAGQGIQISFPANQILVGIGANQVTDAMLALAGATTFKGNPSGATTNPTNMTPAQAAAMLPAFVAAGGGHLKGIVPDPGATAHPNQPYYLGDDGNWDYPYGRILQSFFNAGPNSATGAGPVNINDLFNFTLDVPLAIWAVYSARAYSDTANTNLRDFWYLDSTSLAVIDIFCSGAGQAHAYSHVQKMSVTAGSHQVSVQKGMPNGGSGTWMNRGLVLFASP
jgi:hypothetical protein